MQAYGSNVFKACLDSVFTFLDLVSRCFLILLVLMALIV